MSYQEDEFQKAIAVAVEAGADEHYARLTLAALSDAGYTLIPPGTPQLVGARSGLLSAGALAMVGGQAARR